MQGRRCQRLSMPWRRGQLPMLGRHGELPRSRRRSELLMQAPRWLVPAASSCRLEPTVTAVGQGRDHNE